MDFQAAAPEGRSGPKGGRLLGGSRRAVGRGQAGPAPRPSAPPPPSPPPSRVSLPCPRAAQFSLFESLCVTSLLSSRPRRLRGGRVGTCLHGLAAKTRKAAGETRWHCRPPPHGEAARAPSTPLPRGAPPAARRGSASRAADARSLCRSLKQSLRLSVAPRSRRRSPAVLRRGAATLCREARFRGGVGGARAPGCSSAPRGLRACCEARARPPRAPGSWPPAALGRVAGLAPRAVCGLGPRRSAGASA